MPAFNNKKKFLLSTSLGVLLGLFYSLSSFANHLVNEPFPKTYSEPCINIQIKVFLEGPMTMPYSRAYNNRMRADLNTKRGILPGQTPLNAKEEPTPSGQPYQLPPWNYRGKEGSGWTDADYSNFAKMHGAEVVDWVLVSLVEADENSKKVLSAAAVVLEDGKVVFEQDCFMQPSGSAAYFVLVEHRNHMGVMSPNPIKLEDGLLAFDFTKQNGYLDSPINPTGVGQKEVLPGTFAMFACDGSQEMDGLGYDISSRDLVTWSMLNGENGGYTPADFNMDGDVNGVDKMLWNWNNGSSSRVPR